MTDGNVHKQAKRGIKLLLGRQAILQILTFAGGVFLARKLGPSVFGLYAIATFLVTAFGLFGDFGLAPSFIQRKKEITERDLQVGFTLQQLIAAVLVAVILVSAPWLAHFYPKAPPETVWLVRALAFSLFLTSWRTMSVLQLERQLRYDRLAWIEVVETLIFQGLAVGLAAAGFGVWSFVWATLARGVIGTAIVYATAPWKVRFAFDVDTAREILRFGIPFQLGAIAHNIGGWITPTLVGGMIGPHAVGYLSWASSNGKKPLLLVDNVMRVSFPHFSRIQDDRDEVERLMSRYLTYLLLMSGLWFSLLLVAGPSVVRLVYTSKWLPAVPALVLNAFVLSLDVVVWVVSVSMNACGLVRLAADRAVIRTVAHIVLSIPLVLWLGFNGVPIAYLAMMILTFRWTFRGLGDGAMGRIMRPVLWLLIPAACASAIGMASLQLHVPLIARCFLSTVTVGVAYAIVTFLASPPWLKQSITSRLGSLPLTRWAMARA